MTDKKEAAPQVGTAKGGIVYEGKGKFSVNHCNTEPLKFIRIPLWVLQRENIMELVKAVYLGKYVEGVAYNRDDIGGEVTAATILAHYLPFSDGEIWEAYERYQEMKNEGLEEQYGDIPVGLWERYQNEKGNKLLPFRMFVALKSIIGRNQYARITHRFLLCRMAGYAKPTKENGYDEETFNRERKGHLSDYRIRSIVSVLSQSWNLSDYYPRSIKGGTYYSFKLSRMDLIETVLRGGAKARQMEKKANREREEEEAYMKVFGKKKDEVRNGRKDGNAQHPPMPEPDKRMNINDAWWETIDELSKYAPSIGNNLRNATKCSIVHNTNTITIDCFGLQRDVIREIEKYKFGISQKLTEKTGQNYCIEIKDCIDIGDDLPF